MQTYDIIIVGTGHAGAQVAAQLRALGHDGTIALIGEERDFPYERPPLSKDYLVGAKTFERMAIKAPAFWADKHIDCRLGQRVVRLDPVQRWIEASSGERLGYRQLVWAAGGHARRLTCSGHDLIGLHTIRTREDVDLMKIELDHVDRVAVIGGGYIGLEAAAVLRKLGRQVVLIEAQDRVLARVAGEALSRFFEREHRSRGVDLRLNTTVECMEGEGGVLQGVRLASGELIEASLAVVGVGIIPSIGPLVDAGAKADNGVVVDGHCRTSLEDVFAIGDCAAHRNRYAQGAVVRVESVQNARDQATVVARTIMGQDGEYDAVPWFWSDQYDLKLQTAGLSNGHDATIMRGNPDDRSFSIIYMLEGRVIALDSVNAPADHMAGRKLVEQGVVHDPAVLADVGTPLKSLINA